MRKKLTNILIILTFVLSTICICFGISGCSVEYQLTRECKTTLHLIDNTKGEVIACIHCDSLKQSFVRKVEKHFNKQTK